MATLCDRLSRAVFSSVLVLALAPAAAVAQGLEPAALQPGEFQQFGETRKYFRHWLGVCSADGAACRLVTGRTSPPDHFFFETRLTLEQQRGGAGPVVTVFLGNTELCSEAATVHLDFGGGDRFSQQAAMFQNTCNTFALTDGDQTRQIERLMKAGNHVRAVVEHQNPDLAPQSAQFSLHGVTRGTTWMSQHLSR